ncbi:hypothetical protein P3L10_029724 [Capsicum annuum]
MSLPCDLGFDLLKKVDNLQVFEISHKSEVQQKEGRDGPEETERDSPWHQQLILYFVVFSSIQTKSAPILETSADGASPATAASDQSGDLWSEVKSNVAQKEDRMRFNFLAWLDLSNRKIPGVWLQYKYLIGS